MSALRASPPDPAPGGAPTPGSEDQDKEDSRKFRRTVRLYNLNKRHIISVKADVRAQSSHAVCKLHSWAKAGLHLCR